MQKNTEKSFEKVVYHNYEFPIGQDENFRLFYIYSGALQISTIKDSFELFEGDSMLVFPGEIVGGFTFDTCECGVLYFEKKVCQDFLLHVSNTSKQKEVFRLEHDLDFFEAIKQDEDYFLNKANLYNLLSIFLSKVRLEQRDEENHEFASTVAKYVVENCTKEISLSSLAEFLGYGYNYTSALFKNTFKCGFLFYVNQHRVNLAEKMLNEKNSKSVTEIAFECGFNSLRSLDRNFKEMKGKSPREWQKNS